MTILSEMEFHFDINFDELDLQNTEKYLKGIVSKYSNLVYRQETNVYVKLEDGSLKSTIIITGAIYAAISSYGSFRSGVDYLIKDSNSIKELVRLCSILRLKVYNTQNFIDQTIKS